MFPSLLKYATSAAWNDLQKDLKLKELISPHTFKDILNVRSSGNSGCRCFDLSGNSVDSAFFSH